MWRRKWREAGVKLAQQAARNSKEQFALGDFQQVLMDKIEGIDRYQAMAGQVMGNPNVQKAFGDIMLDLVYQEFERRKVSAEPIQERG
jgi:hypothetical protein